MEALGRDQPTHTLREILSQPDCWAECLSQLRSSDVVEQVRKQAPLEAEWLFIGCGTSYYLAQSAAASFTALTARRARALPASELLLYPDLVLPSGHNYWPVLISRSGRTTEVLQVAEYLRAKRGLRTVAVTCARDEPLEKLATLTLVLAAAQEESTVMTRSFTSMLLGLQFLAASVAGQPEFQSALAHLPGAVAPLLEAVHPRLKDFVAAHPFSDYVFLGQGPFYGLAREAALKVMESSCSYAQSFHTLEFRHGPKSVVGPDVLVGFFLSETGLEAERDVLEEVKELGGTTLVVTNRADARTRAASDFLIELSLGVPEYARLVAYVIWGQLLGCHTGLKKGMNPDAPRHLSRVVVLNHRS